MNEYTPWNGMGLTELEYWKQRYIERQMDCAALMEHNQRLTDDRRERIATAAMQGILASIPPDHEGGLTVPGLVTASVGFADMLIAELDREQEKTP